jgi:hypothetical protein
MKTLPIAFPLPQPRGRQAPAASMLDVCAALFLTLAGLLGLEGSNNGE